CTNPWNFTSDLVTANTTLYAKWNINSYTVTFDSQGGSAVASKATNYNTTISAPSNPTRTGYTFGGWYKETACTNAWNFTTDKITLNTTLYAKWTINTFTITFNTQSGSSIANATVNYNATVIRPADPTLTGYTFGGWYKDAACTNAWNFTSDKVTANTTLYAKWNINSYTVTFNSQGGDIIANINANYNTTITIPVAPTRMGYTFNGWYKETACTNAWNFATDKITANTTLFAKWTINTYTVTFNSDGGTPVSSITTNYFTKIGEPTPPSKAGYTFDGWYQNLSDAFSFNFSLYFITSNLTLTAKWTPITYGVSFYSEGISINYRGVEYNTTITNKPEDPTRTGYIFNGWYKEATFINLWNFATDKVMSTMSLYAKWTALTYKVSYDSQGGTTVPAITVNHGTKISEPTPPTRKGYTLKGWYNQPTNGFIFFFDYTQVTADITLYAHWMLNTYTITFDSKGGTSVNSQTAEYNSTIYAPTNPTRAGYTFDGWFKEEALTSAWNFATDVVSDNATLYAKWNAVVYTVIFNSQGGSSVSNMNANHGTLLTRPADPTRTGYTFAGWYIDASCTTAWNFATDVVTKATMLYAKWNINTYTVSFNSQGGSIIADVTCDYNNTIAEPIAPTRTGYTFAGWYKEYNYITAWNFATDLVSNNTTLYAKWSINIYTVNFDSQGGNAIASISATYNTTISAPTPPTKTGYKFAGWYKETACTNAWLFATDLVTVNMSLYAKWDLSNSINSTSTEDFRLYPNPADDFVTLEGSNMKQASIFNLMGTMIMQLDIKGNDTTTINVSKLMSGNYFIYVKTNDGRVRILKMLKL
ncbi:InlB B-repeat-containing protein, partial [Williamwhitmania taraxaci]